MTVTGSLSIATMHPEYWWHIAELTTGYTVNVRASSAPVAIHRATSALVKEPRIRIMLAAEGSTGGIQLKLEKPDRLRAQELEREHHAAREADSRRWHDRNHTNLNVRNCAFCPGSKYGDTSYSSPDIRSAVGGSERFE